MKNLVMRLWHDEAGFVVSTELILIATIVVIGLIMFMPAGIIAALPIEVLRPENRAIGLGLFYTWWYVGLAFLPQAQAVSRG